MTQDERAPGDNTPPIRVEYPTRLALKGQLDVPALLNQVAEQEGLTIGKLTVILADHELVLKLNQSYLGHDYHTDVLAFPYAAPPNPIEGDIYIDVETARERHEEYQATFHEELARYLIHGFLHLAGHTDKDPEQRSDMKKRESAYLQNTKSFWQQD